MRITLPGTDSGGTNKESQEITTNTEDCYIDDDDLQNDISLYDDEVHQMSIAIYKWIKPVEGI